MSNSILQSLGRAKSDRVPLQEAARELEMSGMGVLRALRRANAAIRHDGRWFCRRDDLERIKQARSLLGARPRKRRGAAIEAA